MIPKQFQSLGDNHSGIMHARGTVHCKLSEVEKFCGFCVSIGNREFSSEIACAINFGHPRLPSNCKCFSVNYSLVCNYETSTLNE